MAEQTAQDQSTLSNPQGSTNTQSSQDSNVQPQNAALQPPASSQPQQDVLSNPNQKTLSVQTGAKASPKAATVKSHMGLTIFFVVAAIIFGFAVWRFLSRIESKTETTEGADVPKDTPVITSVTPLPIMRSSTLNAGVQKPKKKKKKTGARKHR